MEQEPRRGPAAATPRRVAAAAMHSRASASVTAASRGYGCGAATEEEAEEDSQARLAARAARQLAAPRLLGRALLRRRQVGLLVRRGGRPRRLYRLRVRRRAGAAPAATAAQGGHGTLSRRRVTSAARLLGAPWPRAAGAGRAELGAACCPAPRPAGGPGDCGQGRRLCCPRREEWDGAMARYRCRRRRSTRQAACTACAPRTVRAGDRPSGLRARRVMADMGELSWDAVETADVADVGSHTR